MTYCHVRCSYRPEASRPVRMGVPTTLILAVCFACATPTAAPTQAQVQYQATAKADSAWLFTSAVIENTGHDASTIALGEKCIPRTRLYRSSDRRGPPVWDGTTLPCFPFRRVIVLRPQQRDTVAEPVSLSQILGDSLPPGRYYVSAVLDLPARFIELPAGSVELRSPIRP